MRITNSMMVNNLRRNLNTNLQHMDEYQSQLSTGRRINKPSDDPAGTVKALRLRTSLNEGEQYLDNIGEAINYMETTDASFQNINEVMQRIRELTVKAATGTNNADEEMAIAKEIGELNDQLKMVANSTYGSKYIFSGTNVTEAPYQDGEWVGNQETLNIEISSGVNIAVNIPTMKEFFTGRLDQLSIAEDTSVPPKAALQGLLAKNIQEGHYNVNTQIGPAAASTAAEAQSYLGSINKNRSFFYNDNVSATPPVTLGAGTAALANDSAYNASLMVEVKKVQAIYPPGTPRGSLTASVPGAPVLTFNQGIYMRDGNDAVLNPNGTDLAANFTYTRASGSTANLTDADYVAGALPADPSAVTFTVTGTPATGDTIIWNNDVGGQGKGKAYGADGKEYTPVKAVYDGTKWVYDDISKVTVDIKGHVYSGVDGAYKYVELKDVTLNMETANGGALFTIPSTAFNKPDGTPDPSFPNGIVIWNKSGAALGGIDPRNPQIAVGDKTIISVTATQAAATTQRVDFGYTFLDRYGKATAEKTTSFAFQNGFFDNNTRDLKFFSLNQETGLTYDGSIGLKNGTFAASNPAKPHSSFDFQAGIFGYVEDLVRKIQVGKLPQVGNELAGNDLRLKELLLQRATIGARVNRLELQQSRLTSTQESYTDLLSKNEDANEAEVILNLQMQENVYRASLGAGAKIIQPSLIDFLR